MATEDLQCIVEQGDLNFQALNGDINIQAADSIAAGADEIIIGNVDHGIVITKDNNIEIRANKLILEAPIINVYGDNVLN